MKKTINFSLRKLLFLPLIILMTFTSCQNEVTEVTGPNEQETIVANSTLANLVQSTTMRDGSFDNIIDNANCITVNLPVTVVVNGLEITIDSEEDFGVIEAIYDEFSDDDDILEIVFPITIILNDYTEVTINSLEELEGFVEECAGENEDDDDIECIDFQYPISISVYDSNFEVIETVEINDDEELYNFIDDLEGGVLASLNFPVTMVLADGSTVEVNNNDELQAAIEAAEDACDEDDDNDYDDDDNNDIPVDDLNILCSNCTWSVARLEIDNQDLEDQYVGYVFTFVPEGPVYVEAPDGNEYEGTWGLTENDNGIPALMLNIPDLPDFNNELWLLNEIIEYDDDIYVDFRNGEDRLKFERLECDDDEEDGCGEEDVDAYFAECHWVGDINSTADFNDYDFYFLGDQVLKAIDANNTYIYGTWMTSEDANGDVVVTIEMPAPLMDFNGEWTVIECEEERIKLTKGDDYIVYERVCEEDNCSEEQIELSLKECFWNIPIYNDSDVFANTYIDFESDYDFVVFMGDDLVYGGEWTVAENNNGGYELTLTTNWSDLNGTWEVVTCGDGYFQFLNENINMKLAKDCDTNLENPFPCFDDWDYELTSCDYDGDGVANFNIYEAFPDCSVSGVSQSVSFHLSLQGAENNTDELSGATSFNNTTSPQTVYIRISILNSEDVYEIYPVDLIVEDCTTPCSEQDVNAYLTECKWNVVSLNGDDHLIAYDFDFNTGGELIITNTSTNETEDANWLVFESSTTGRLILGFTNINNNDLSDVFGNWGLVECAQDRLKFEKEDGTYMVLEKDCN